MSTATDKQKRYDRQLRLWGEHGQTCMEDCTVCLINGTACGAEALKNLVLPGARAAPHRRPNWSGQWESPSLATTAPRHRILYHCGRRRRVGGGPGQQLLR